MEWANSIPLDCRQGFLGETEATSAEDRKPRRQRLFLTSWVGTHSKQVRRCDLRIDPDNSQTSCGTESLKTLARRVRSVGGFHPQSGVRSVRCPPV